MASAFRKSAWGRGSLTEPLRKKLWHASLKAETLQAIDEVLAMEPSETGNGLAAARK